MSLSVKTLLRVTLPLLLISGVFAESRTNVPEFSSSRAWGHLLAQTDLGPRNPGSDGHYLARQYYVETLRQFADTVRQQRFRHKFPYTSDEYRFTNIIAEFGPDTERRVLLGAHWDTRPWADRDPNFSRRDEPIIGANDGASGVAVLLEFARIFSEVPPPVGVTIVLFDAEDMGRSNYIDQYALGSKYYAEQLQHPGQFRYAVILDMVGDANLQLPMENNSRRIAPDLTRKIWNIADSLGYDVFQDRVGDSIHDDHLMLYRHAGIPAVDIIDFRYPDRSHAYWHTHQDTPDKCSPQSLKIVGDVVLHLLYREKDVSE